MKVIILNIDLRVCPLLLISESDKKWTWEQSTVCALSWETSLHWDWLITWTVAKEILLLKSDNSVFIKGQKKNKPKPCNGIFSVLLFYFIFYFWVHPACLGVSSDHAQRTIWDARDPPCVSKASTLPAVLSLYPSITISLMNIYYTLILACPAHYEILCFHFNMKYLIHH